MHNQERITKLIANKLDLSEEDVTLTADFEDDLGADSLDQIELVMCFEEEFDIMINDDESKKITNVQSILDYLEANQ